MLSLLKEDVRLCEIPVVMMSANEEVSIISLCIDKGARDYLIKPIQLQVGGWPATLPASLWLAGLGGKPRMHGHTSQRPEPLVVLTCGFAALHGLLLHCTSTPFLQVVKGFHKYFGASKKKQKPGEPDVYERLETIGRGASGLVREGSKAQPAYRD